MEYWSDGLQVTSFSFLSGEGGCFGHVIFEFVWYLGFVICNFILRVLRGLEESKEVLCLKSDWILLSIG